MARHPLGASGARAAPAQPALQARVEALEAEVAQLQAQVRRLCTRLRAELGPKAGAAHMHNTRGLGLANCLAAYDVGVRTFDASQGGLGGCPYAPGASGNVVTEDLVFMFEAMGIATGVDYNLLMAAREALQTGLPDEPLYGMTPLAGLPKGWQPAA